MCKHRVSVSGWSPIGFEGFHPKSTPYYFSFLLILPVTHVFIHDVAVYSCSGYYTIFANICRYIYCIYTCIYIYAIPQMDSNGACSFGSSISGRPLAPHLPHLGRRGSRSVPSHMSLMKTSPRFERSTLRTCSISHWCVRPMTLQSFNQFNHCLANLIDTHILSIHVYLLLVTISIKFRLHVGWSKFAHPGTTILRKIIYFRDSLIFPGSHMEQQCLLCRLSHYLLQVLGLSHPGS